MADRAPTLSDAIDLGTALHDEDVRARLRRREERNRAKLSQLNHQTSDETPAPAVPVATVAAPPVPVSPPLPEPTEARSAPAPNVEPIELRTPAEPERSGPPQRAEGPKAPAPARPRRPSVSPKPPSETAPSADTARAETLPTERYLKVRNSILDRLPRFVKGNRYLVYQHIYRNTLGRQQAQPEAFFVSRVVAEQLRLSEKTVRTAWKYLEGLGLIETSSTHGSHFGVRVRVLDVDDVIGRLEDSSVTFTDDHRQELPLKASLSGNIDRSSAVRVTAEGAASAVTLTAIHERHEEEDISNTMHGVGEALDEITATLVSRYGFTPDRARRELSLVAASDLPLVPALLERLDAEIARRRVANPAGLLVTWLRAFPSWRPVLDRSAVADEGERESQAAAEGDAFLTYLEETDARARAMLAAMDPTELESLRTTVRAKAEARSAAALRWTPAQWEAHIGPLLVAELRERFEGFEAWRREKRTP